MHTELYYSCGFVVSSKFRESVMKSLSKSDNTPTKLAKLNDMNVVHISKALQQLKKRGLVVCLNEKDRMNRIYSLTEMGWNVVNFIH